MDRFEFFFECRVKLHQASTQASNMTHTEFCFSVLWAGSNQLIAPRLSLCFKKGDVKTSALKLQGQVAQLANVEPHECIKILLGSPAGPQLTPVLRSRTCKKLEEEPAHKAMVSAWLSLKPDHKVNVFVTQHDSVALAIDQLVSSANAAYQYNSLPANLRCNPLVALTALDLSTYWAMVELPLPLLSNKTFALCAMRRCKRPNAILGCFDYTIREDEDVVLAAVARHRNELYYASGRLRHCRAFVLNAVLVNGLCIQWAASELRQDYEIALAAVRQNKEAIMYLCHDVRQHVETQQAPDCNIPFCNVS
jgi:hypothetical protein